MSALPRAPTARRARQGGGVGPRGALPRPAVPLARMVLAALAAGPGTAEELGLHTHLPAGVVDAALADLRSAGRAEEAAERRWQATRRGA